MRVANNSELVPVIKRHNRFLMGAFMSSALMLPLIYKLIQIHSVELQLATGDFKGFENCEYTLFSRPNSLVRICANQAQVEIHTLSFSDVVCAQKLDQACAAINHLAELKPQIESLMGGFVLVWAICCALLDRTMHQIEAILKAGEGDQDPEQARLVPVAAV